MILDPVVRDWPSFKELPLMSFSWHEASATIDQAGGVAPNAANNDSTVILSKLAECDQPSRITHLAAETGLSEKRVRTCLTALAAKDKVIESIDPNHKQRKLYRLPDIGDNHG